MITRCFDLHIRGVAHSLLSLCIACPAGPPPTLNSTLFVFSYTYTLLPISLSACFLPSPI